VTIATDIGAGHFWVYRVSIGTIHHFVITPVIFLIFKAV